MRVLDQTSLGILVSEEEGKEESKLQLGILRTRRLTNSPLSQSNHEVREYLPVSDLQSGLLSTTENAQAVKVCMDKFKDLHHLNDFNQVPVYLTSGGNDGQGFLKLYSKPRNMDGWNQLLKELVGSRLNAELLLQPFSN
jgi:hypothetical protein